MPDVRKRQKSMKFSEHSDNNSLSTNAFKFIQFTGAEQTKFFRLLQAFPNLEVIEFGLLLPLYTMNKCDADALRLLICTIPNLKIVRGLDLFNGSDPQFGNYFLKKYEHQIKELQFDYPCLQSDNVLFHLRLKTIIARCMDYRYGIFNDGLEKLYINSDPNVIEKYSFVNLSLNLKSLSFTAKVPGHLLVLSRLKSLKDLRVYVQSLDAEKEGQAFRLIAKSCPIAYLSVSIDNNSDITPILKSFSDFKELLSFKLSTLNYSERESVFSELNSRLLQTIVIMTSYITKEFFTRFNFPHLIDLYVTEAKFLFDDTVIKPLIGLKHLETATIKTIDRNPCVSQENIDSFAKSIPSLEYVNLKSGSKTLLKFDKKTPYYYLY